MKMKQETNADSENELIEKIYEQRVIGNRDEKNAALSASLFVNECPKKGRYVEAKDNIKAGEVLLQETPFAAWIKPSLIKTYCNHCFKRLKTCDIYCARCENIFYCSLKCHDESSFQYHQTECNFLSLFRLLSKGQLALRVVFKANIEQLFSENEMKIESKSSEDVGEYEKIFDLVDHLRECTYTNLMFDVFGAIFLSLLLKKLSLIDDKSVLIVGKVLLKHLLQINMNGIQIMEQRIADVQQLPSGEIIYKIESLEDSKGLGLYTNISLVNHSCYNVTKSLFNGNQLSLVAIADLGKGDEITYNYGPHYKFMPKSERQTFLRDFYYFDCECKACIEDWF
ncbi:SET and MYND domain-containing protein 4-like protein [Dinothrombium tinctorium]|uniref:Protein-lysine N-methyltransferase SMYD4 n=1 Tax=Dinothrombium tinctorium TaxID=1965070 RepID=A0A3S3PLH3_9ACAR|nr:SET and MYND domain-containing protein 4-like protein [Dinothrombium tinctorium]